MYGNCLLIVALLVAVLDKLKVSENIETYLPLSGCPANIVLSETHFTCDDHSSLYG